MKKKTKQCVDFTSNVIHGETCSCKSSSKAARTEQSEGHTPTPWRKLVGGKLQIASDNTSTIIGEIYSQPNVLEKYENAEFIVRAVNSHEALLRELKSAIFYIETYGGEVTSNFAADGNLTQIKEIIRQAEGKDQEVQS